MGNNFEDLGIITGEDENLDVSEELRSVDVLDLMFIEFVAADPPTRREASKKFGISKDQARLRLEELYEKDLVGKAALCQSCNELIHECTCGKESKIIRYYRDVDGEAVEEIKKFRKLLQNFRGVDGEKPVTPSK
jgi:hypothetical protein